MSTTMTRRAILAGAVAITATAALPAGACAIDPDAELRNLAALAQRRTRVRLAVLAEFTRQTLKPTFE